MIRYLGEKLKLKLSVFAFIEYVYNHLNVTAVPLQFLDIPFDYLSILFFSYATEFSTYQQIQTANSSGHPRQYADAQTNI